jgi:anti-sigma regulatory factor (Ser/Thr protein kinase)
LPATRTSLSHGRAFPATRDALVDVRTFIRGLCYEAGVVGPLADDLSLCTCEAAANAIVHSGSRRFRVSWADRGDRVEIQVRDQGLFRRVPDADADGVHGIALMTALMDEVSVRRGTARRPGTHVRMVKRLDPEDRLDWEGRRTQGGPRITLPEAPARSGPRPPARGR